MVAQNPILSDPDCGGTDPHISPRISSKCWAALNCVLKIGPLLQDPWWTWGAGTLFSYSQCLYLLTYIQYQCLHVICCCMLPCTFFTNFEGVMHYCLSLSNRLLFLPTIRFSCVSWRMLGLNPVLFQHAVTVTPTFPRLNLINVR